MAEGYIPENSEREILVKFNITGCGDEFAKNFGEPMGCELVGRYAHIDDVFIYRTPEDKRDVALKTIRRDTRFVEWAEIRDLKLERRWNHLERAVSMLKDLHSDVEIPDADYDRRLQEISHFIKDRP